MKPLPQVLPAEVRAEISAQMNVAVSRAVTNFGSSKGDEDAITGTLLAHLEVLATGKHTSNGSTFSWKTQMVKVRGRGPGAPEKRYGADAVLEVVVTDSEQGDLVLARKALLMQGKKEWSGTDRKLLEQCEDMVAVAGPHGSIAVDYEASGFFAVSSEVVIRRHGNRGYIAPSELKSLSSTLEEEFLECRLGTSIVKFDPARERFFNVLSGEIIPARFKPKRHAVIAIRRGKRFGP